MGSSSLITRTNIELKTISQWHPVISSIVLPETIQREGVGGPRHTALLERVIGDGRMPKTSQDVGGYSPFIHHYINCTIDYHPMNVFSLRFLEMVEHEQ